MNIDLVEISVFLKSNEVKVGILIWNRGSNMILMQQNLEISNFSFVLQMLLKSSASEPYCLVLPNSFSIWLTYNVRIVLLSLYIYRKDLYISWWHILYFRSCSVCYYSKLPTGIWIAVFGIWESYLHKLR